MPSCAYARVVFSWPVSSLLTRTAGVDVMTGRCGRGVAATRPGDVLRKGFLPYLSSVFVTMFGSVHVEERQCD